MQFGFNSGQLFGTLSDLTGTPVQFGALQGADVDISFTDKPLYGSQQYPLTVARGQAKISGKAKFAQFNGLLMNQLFFGQAPSVGQLGFVSGEQHPIPSTPFTVTATNGATFSEDLGVTYVATGLPLTRVYVAPTAAGTYEVNVSTGVYTFDSADTGLSVALNYTYTIASGGNNLVVTNQLVGVAPNFIAVFNNTYNGKALTLRLNACVSSKLTISSKLEDFIIPEFDWMSFADASGNVMTLSLAE